VRIGAVRQAVCLPYLLLSSVETAILAGMRWFSPLMVLCFLPAIGLPATPEVVSGKAASAVDGDTFVLNAENVYLTGVRAPELDQPYGKEARKALEKMVAKKLVRVQVSAREDEGGVFGVAYVGKLCVNTALVRLGHAWHDPESLESKTLLKAQSEARQKRRGLWATLDPIAPWTWRENHPLGEGTAAAKAARPSTKPSEKSPQKIPPTGGYWLNTSSGTRHNSKCRYFGKTKNGRPCSPNEGTPCKICGG